MTTYTKSGAFGWAGGGKSGAIVDLWAASRFGSPPVEGNAPPSGDPDAGPVTTGSEFGSPGAYTITGITVLQDYYVRVQYGGVSYWGEVPLGSLGGAPGGGGITEITSTGHTVTVTDPTGPTTNLEVASSGIDLPIADTTGYAVDDSTYTNPVTGSGKLTTAIFPADTVCAAWAISGDAFPRVLLLSDPTDSVLYLGNGTYNPYLDGAAIAVGSDSFHSLGLAGHSGSAQIGIDDTNIGSVSRFQEPVQIGASSTDQGALSFARSSGGTPTIGGNVGDICILFGGAPYTIYRCTTAGAPGTAVWTAMVGMTAGGALIPPAFSSAPAYVKGAMYYDTTLSKLRIGGATAWETVTSS